MIQDHVTVTVLAGPVKLSMPFTGQSLFGTVICTRIVCLGERVLLAGLKLMPFIPLLLADQLKF